MDASKLQEMTDWLIDGARSATEPDADDGRDLRAAGRGGLPLWRVGVFVRTLHPDIYGRNFIWKPGEEVELGTVDFDILKSPDFNASPLSIVFQQGHGGSVPASTIPQAARFPIVETCAPKASPIISRCRCCSSTARSTHRAGPRNSRAASPTRSSAALRAIVSPLARVVEIIGLRRIAARLLDTYVGNRAGERILGGQIRRGHTETMNAAIWLSDLRGFTALSDRLPAETVVDILNHYFDCQVAAIKNHGGEVLKYMGDGLLAVFPIDEYVGDAQQVCSHVLEAARERAPASTPCNIRSATRSSVSASASHCMSGGFSTAISAAATGSTSPASVPRSISRHGWKRSPASSAAPSWRRRDFAGICGGGWSDLGEFPIAGFAKAAARLRPARRRNRRVAGIAA